MTQLTDIRGIGPALAHALTDHGFRTPADLAAAKPADLIKVRTIGPLRAKTLIAGARAAVSGTASVPAKPAATAITRRRAPRTTLPAKPAAPAPVPAPIPAAPAPETEEDLRARKKAKAKAKADKAKKKAEALEKVFAKAKKKAKVKAKKVKAKDAKAKAGKKAKKAKKKAGG